MANAKKLASGNYRVRIDVGRSADGKRIMKSFTAKTKREAELLALQYTQGDTAQLPDSTFEECMDNFFKIAVLKPSSKRGYKTLQKTLKNEYKSFCSLTAYEINSKEIQSLLNDYSLTRKPKSVVNMFGFIQTVLHKTCNEDAVYKVKIKSGIKYVPYMPQKEEIEKIIDYLKNNLDLLIPVLLAAFNTLRRSEIGGIDFDKDVDFENGTIHICRGRTRDENNHWVIDTTKSTTSDRYIKPPSYVIDLIKQHGRITNYVPGSISKAFWRALDDLGIPHFRFHDLRHYSISIRHALGIPDEYIISESGHSTDYIMKNLYRHELSDFRKEMIEKTNVYFDDFFKDKK